MTVRLIHRAVRSPLQLFGENAPQGTRTCGLIHPMRHPRAVSAGIGRDRIEIPKMEGNEKSPYRIGNTGFLLPSGGGKSLPITNLTFSARRRAGT
jgi:hypothetical protein